MTRRGLLAVAAIGLLLVTRLPLLSGRLHAWDSVQYALAIERFDLAAHRPHPPGSILYVAAARLGVAAGLDENAALLAVGLLLSAVALLAAIPLGARLAPPHGDWALPLLLLASPIFWFHGLVALPHVAEAAFSTLVGALLLRPGPAAAIGAGLALGLAGGFRAYAEAFLVPLFAIALARRPARERAAAVAAAAAATAAWFVPTARAAGGVGPFVEIARAHAAASHVPPLLAGDIAGAARLAAVAAGYVVIAAPAVILAGVPRAAARLCGRPAGGPGAAGGALILAWVAPPVASASLVHFGWTGFLLGALPPLLAVGLRGRSAGFALAAAAASAAVFLWGPFDGASRADVAGAEADVAARVALVRKAPADGTLVLTGRGRLVGGYRHAMWYLPEYDVASAWWDRALPEDSARPRYRLARGRAERFVDRFEGRVAPRRIVLFDGDADLRAALAPPGAWEVDRLGAIEVPRLEMDRAPDALRRLDEYLVHARPEDLGGACDEDERRADLVVPVALGEEAVEDPPVEAPARGGGGDPADDVRRRLEGPTGRPLHPPGS